jgi:hypothetical protein
MCDSLEIADASFGSLVQRVLAKHCANVVLAEGDPAGNVAAALVAEIRRRVSIARASLVDSLRVAPLYPVLQTLRYVVVDAGVLMSDDEFQIIVDVLFEVAEVRRSPTFLNACQAPIEQDFWSSSCPIFELRVILLFFLVVLR